MPSQDEPSGVAELLQGNWELGMAVGHGSVGHAGVWGSLWDHGVLRDVGQGRAQAAPVPHSWFAGS